MLNEAIIREGKPHSPGHLDELRTVAGAKEALELLRSEGYLLIVVTNQPNVARRLQDRSVVDVIHQTLKATLPLDDIRVCFHDDDELCACRKPEPGLLVSAARDWGICMNESYIIGDRCKDVEAGRRAGCRTILLKSSYNEGESESADYCAESLAAAVAWILSTKAHGQRGA